MHDVQQCNTAVPKYRDGSHLDAVSGCNVGVLVRVNLHHAYFALHVVCNALQIHK